MALRQVFYNGIVGLIYILPVATDDLFLFSFRRHHTKQEHRYEVAREKASAHKAWSANDW